MRLILLAVAAVIVKVGLTAFGVELTWLQAIVATILAQVFAFMFAGNQRIDIGIIRTKEDDV